MKLVLIMKEHWCLSCRLLLMLLMLLGALSACSRHSDSTSPERPPSKPVQQTSLRVSQAHMYVIPPGQRRAAIYMRLKNQTNRTHTLLYASTAIAGATEVHHTVHEDGMMKMRQVQHLKINAGQEIDFEPGGYHIMLLDVAVSPKAGDTVDLMLEFDGQTIAVPVAVKALE